MTVVDFLIIIFCLFFTFQGLFKGFLLELFSVLALAAGLLAGVNYQSLAASRLENILPEGSVREAAGFAAVFLVVWLAVKIMGWILNKNMGEAETNPLSRLAGGAIGLGKSIIIVSVLVYMGESFSPGNRITGGNKFTPVCMDIAQQIQDIVPLSILPRKPGK
ncbi:MAG: hypothetical protein DRG82_14350 [Deltaproteobacteria bacterium]|nr:MAG: hypothetical protein DRG82_14350 [Deltaproteobacteria bacterium]